MKLSLLHRTIFTLILSGIMSASMTYLVSSFYSEPDIDKLVLIWMQAWMTAFIVIFILSPFLHGVTKYLTNILKN